MSLLLAGRRVPGSPCRRRGACVSGEVCGGEGVGSGPPRDLLRFLSLPLYASVRPPPPLPSAARGRSASFPTGSVISCAPGVVRDLFPGGGRDALALLEAPAAPPPPRLSGTDGAGVALPRAGVGAGAAGGLARPAPPSGPRVSAPLLSGYLALAFRRGGLKTPGGSPYRPRGRGGGGARRDVGRLREGFPVPPHVRRSLRLSGPPSGRRRFPRRRSGGACREPPLGARGVPGPSAWLVPPVGGPPPGAGFVASRVPCVPPFRLRPGFFFFFFSRVSRFVSRWPA